MNNRPEYGHGSRNAASPASAAAFGEAAVSGLDIVEIGRVERVLRRTPGFRLRVFTEGERDACDKAANPAVQYAMRFAAKQAVLKALGRRILSGIALADVEIVCRTNGRYAACLHGKARAIARESGVVEIPVSLSFTHTEAVACALAITAGALPDARKDDNPLTELSNRFKEARSMLDDLPAKKVPDETGGSGEASQSNPLSGKARKQDARKQADAPEQARLSREGGRKDASEPIGYEGSLFAEGETDAAFQSSDAELRDGREDDAAKKAERLSGIF